VTYIRAALELGRVEAALSRLEKVLPREGTNAEALLCMSYAMHLLGEEKAAHMWETKALDQDPKIKDKVKIKPVDKEAERPNDLGHASAKAKKPVAVFAPAGQTPSTAAPSTTAPSTAAPSTAAPSTAAPSTAAPSTAAPSTKTPSTP
jgi:hypothetical protein